MKEKDIRQIVREGYAQIARKGQSGCCSGDPCCSPQPDDIGRRIGYSEEEMGTVPAGANLGLGCGNPLALASLKPGEIVLDLGSGAGFDCFLAAQKVGPTGRVIGVDMTPEMILRARDNARKGGYTNVEFRLGDIEHLPIADFTVDIIISNCVINLSTDKRGVFREAYRVLRNGGRLMISDIVLKKQLPEQIRQSSSAYIGCLSGAILKSSYLKAMKAAEFTDVHVLDETPFPMECMGNDPTIQGLCKDLGLSRDMLSEIGRSIISIKLSGMKRE